MSTSKIISDSLHKTSLSYNLLHFVLVANNVKGVLSVGEINGNLAFVIQRDMLRDSNVTDLAKFLVKYHVAVGPVYTDDGIMALRIEQSKLYHRYGIQWLSTPLLTNSLTKMKDKS